MTSYAAAQAAARQCYGKLVAYLSARTHDVAGAEDALADAFEAALHRWPVQGVPAAPEAWLLTAARHRLIDTARQRKTQEHNAAQLLLLVDEVDEVDDTQAQAHAIPDQRLALMFACAHPAIDATVRAPLMLQVLLGFDAASIASAFLTSPTTMGQRLVRAKAKIKQSGMALVVPDRHDMPERLDTVLAATYAAFAEGWLDPTGAETRRRSLAEEGLWLARLLASLMPQEPEALGLLALMLYTHARRFARRSAAGDYVPLAQQDTALWDKPLLLQAQELLLHASSFQCPGRYQLEAAVQSAHVHAVLSGVATGAAVLGLYDALLHITQSPVVAINRAVALAQCDGINSKLNSNANAVAALEALDTLLSEPRLRDYQPYWAARAHVLQRLGQNADAAAAYQRAIGLESDAAVRRYLQQRWDEVTEQLTPQ